MNMKKIAISVLAVLTAVSIAVPAFADNENSNKDKEKGGENGKSHLLVGSTLEVHINDNGTTLVRGAKVTAVSGNTISATTGWGNTVIAWTVITDGNTQFTRRFGGKGSVAETLVNHIISFQGPLATGGTGLTVNAKVVKNWSTEKVESAQSRVFEGTLKSLAATAAPTTMVVRVGDVDYTVNVPANISILNNLWLMTSLTNFHVGDHIRLYGVVSGATINASVVRDTSIVL